MNWLKLQSTPGVKILVNSELKDTVPVRQACIFYELSYKVIDWAAKIKSTYHIAAAQGKRTDHAATLVIGGSWFIRTEEELRCAIALADGAYTNKDLMARSALASLLAER